MNGNDRNEFLMWMQTHTALGRVNLGELRVAFDRAEAEAGYSVVKAEPQGGHHLVQPTSIEGYVLKASR